MTDSFIDLIAKTIKENEEYFTNDKNKGAFHEIVELANDSIDLIPNSDDISNPRTVFWLHALQPLSSGIFVCLISGNVLACFMQLRLLVEYLALYSMTKSLPGDGLLEKYEQIRSDYDGKTISKLLKDFDSDAFELWKKLSEWHHAKTYSARIEKTTVDEGVTLWSIIQPAPYSKEDAIELKELEELIQIFRQILKRTLLQS